jgi:hypothetical protein
LLAQEREAVVNQHHHEHSFLVDFQPLQLSGAKSKGTLIAFMLANAALNTAALFGVFFVIGRALRMGLGL